MKFSRTSIFLPFMKKKSLAICVGFTENSQKFRHYDLDRIFETLRKSAYKHGSYEFELFERSSPFNEDFIPYYKETLLWTCQHLSDCVAEDLRKWIDEDPLMLNRYFYEVDLIALLS